jgi:peptide/nickel transport system permease protein
MIEELGKEYIVAAHGRGLPRQSVIWIHALRNVMIPALNSTALSAASLIMGVFVVEAVFGFPGISELISGAMLDFPDVPVAMGFAVYSVLLVLPVMLVSDVIQGIVDPRIREGVTES